MNTDLDDLGNKIRQAKHGDASPEEIQKQKDNENSKAGSQAGIEFVGAIFIPTLIGYWIDDWLDTLPLFMISLFFLGTATGFYNIYRITQGLGSSVGLSGLQDQKKNAKKAPELNTDKNKEERKGE